MLYISSPSFELGTTQPVLPPTSNSVQLMSKNWEAEKRIKQRKNVCEEALKMAVIFGFSIGRSSECTFDTSEKCVMRNGNFGLKKEK